MNDENDESKNHSNEDDWSMTMPHQRLDKAMKAENFDDYAPKYDAPNRQQQQSSASDDWAMTTPNINIAPQSSQPPASSDFDKTTPNINIPQNAWDDQNPNVASPSQSSQPIDDWSMTKPNITREDVNLQREEKRDTWEMPEPTFRVSEGMTTGFFQKPQEEPDDFGKFPAARENMNFSVGAGRGDEDISTNKTTPNFRISEEGVEDYGQIAQPSASVPPQVVESSAAAAASQAGQSAPAKKPMSKLPFIVGGLLVLFLFGGAALAVVYFLFLRQPETATRVLPPVEEKSENIPSSNKSASTESSPSLTATESTSLPQQINHKGAMMLVSAGEFTMGSDAAGDDEAAKPAHKVTLPAFYIDKYEVTNEQYKEFCDATGRTHPPDPDFEAGYFLKRPKSPVMGISFADAKTYAEWAGKRLPTEAEWEKAASWDEKTQTKRDFPWSSQFESGNAAFNTGEPSDVGKFANGASPYGVMDMSGNVIEWVDAFYQPYPNNTVPNAEFGEKNRVVRGGHFGSKTDDRLKTTKRIYVPANFTADAQRAVYIGFRCAVSADDARLKDVLQSK